MKRLEIDFVRRGRGSAWPRRILLATALALSVDAGLSWRRLDAEVNLARASAAQAQPRKPSARSVPAEELAAVRETLERLALPWERLFGALESASSDEVALLAIEPDSKAGTVVISGDSKNYLAALSYVLNLSRAEALGRVQLVRHEVRTNDPQRPVAFSVSASWSEARP
jgi:hypothetical protein